MIAVPRSIAVGRHHSAVFDVQVDPVRVEVFERRLRGAGAVLAPDADGQPALGGDGPRFVDGDPDEFRSWGRRPDIREADLTVVHDNTESQSLKRIQPDV